jgi:hypothetical protein
MHRLVIALTTLIGLTGATVVAAYLLFFSASADRAATLVPGDTAFYLNVYLQPSTGQRMNLSGLLGRVPGFEDTSTLDEKIDQVAQNLLAETGLDYREQVKPWLGDQVAIAAWPAEGEAAEAEPILLAEVKDPEAARTALDELEAERATSFATETYAGVELHVSDATAYAFVEEMLVIGPAADAIRAVVDVAGGADSLADREAFRSTLDGLPDDHLASLYIDLAAIAETTGVADQLSGLSTAGAALVAETDGLHLAGSAPFDMEEAEASSRAGFAMGSQPSSLVDWMPEDTVAEVVVFGLREMLENAETAVGSTPGGEDVTGTLDTLRALAAFGLGIDLDADVLPLLDREVAIAVSGIEGDLPSGQILLRPEDPDAATEALGRLASALEGAGADLRTEDVDGTEITVIGLPDTGEAAYAAVDGIIVLGFTVEDVAAAIAAHGSGESLGGSDAYERAFEVAGTRGGNEAWVNVAAVVDLMGDGAELPADVRDILGQIGAFGFTAPSRDDQIEFHAVLTVDDARPE